MLQKCIRDYDLCSFLEDFLTQGGSSSPGRSSLLGISTISFAPRLSSICSISSCPYLAIDIVTTCSILTTDSSPFCQSQRRIVLVVELVDPGASVQQDSDDLLPPATYGVMQRSGEPSQDSQTELPDLRTWDRT